MLPAVAHASRAGAPLESTEAELGLEALDEKLTAHGINTKLYGKQAGSKPLSFLLAEIQQGDSHLEESGGGSLTRVFKVAEIELRCRGQVLVEAFRTSPDGRERERGALIAAKFQAGESWEQAAARGLGEELDLKSEHAAFLSDSFAKLVVNKTSLSFPGLFSRYDIFHVACELDAGAVSRGECARLGVSADPSAPLSEFQTEKGGQARSWAWVAMAELNARIGLPRVALDAASLDEDEELHVVRDAILLLLAHHYRERCARLQCKMLTGAFSGRVVLHVRPFEPSGQEMEARIFRFDDADSVDEEFERYQEIQGALPEFVPEQSRIDHAIERTAGTLRLPTLSVSKRVVDRVVGLEVELAGACWTVPGLAVRNDDALLADLKRIYCRENEREVIARKIEGSKSEATTQPERKLHFQLEDSPWPRVGQILKDFFGSGGIFDRLLSRTSGRLEAGSLVLGDVSPWKRIEKRLREVFPEIAFADDIAPEEVHACESRLMAEADTARASYFVESAKTLAELSEVLQIFAALSAEMGSLDVAWVREHAPPICLTHGDLNGANVMVDLHANLWLVDFADVERDFVYRDVAKLLCVMLFEYTVIPITKEQAAQTPVERLAAQLQCNRADAKRLLEELKHDSVEGAVLSTFTEDAERSQYGVRITRSESEVQESLEDGKAIINSLVEAVLEKKFIVPVVLGETFGNLRSVQMLHTAQAVNDMLLQASQRLGSRGDAKADRHPASLFMLVLDIALKCLEDPKLTSSQKQLALHLVKHWAPRLPAVLRTDPSELREVDEKEMEAKDQPWHAEGFVDAEREHYRSRAQVEHGVIVNPITGDQLDIMEQCVNLRIDANNRDIGDHEAYDEVLITFARVLPLHLKVWVDTRSTGYKTREARITRVNTEDRTYDVSYEQLQADGKVKTLVLPDLQRHEVETEPLLVLGDPAAGKTTFSKQLLTWVMRENKHQHLVPAMIRVVDLVRNKEKIAGLMMNDTVTAYLKLHCTETRFEFFKQAREQGRFLLILDGFDEAGELEEKLHDEITRIYIHDLFLVITTRDMAAINSSPTFARFRRIRVKDLNEDQQRQVVVKQLGEAVGEKLLGQLKLNPALAQMAVNPLLLNVTITVFKSGHVGESGGLNRAKVYSIALDSMLSKVGGLDAPRVAPLMRRQSSNPNAHGGQDALRLVMRCVAWLAHTTEDGRGIRDFTSELVERAIRMANTAEFTAHEWHDLVDSQIKRGRLPLMTWIPEEGRDKFRFAHLTFQEFLCAEHILSTFERGDDRVDHERFADELTGLICPRGLTQVFERGWWQQVIQMFSDLARSTEAGTRYAVLLAEKLLGVTAESDNVRLRMVDDRNILTLVSLITDSSLVTSLALSPGQAQGMTSVGAKPLSIALHTLQLVNLNLSSNDIGPDGGEAIALWLKDNKSVTSLDLHNNLFAYGRLHDEVEHMAMARDLSVTETPLSVQSRTQSFRSPRSHAVYEADNRAFAQLAESIKHHPSLTKLDLRANGFGCAAAELVWAAVEEHPSLQEISGIPIDKLKAGEIVDLSLHGGSARGERLWLEAGGCLLLAKLMDKYPTPLTRLRLTDQKLSCDPTSWNLAIDDGKWPHYHNPTGVVELARVLARIPTLTYILLSDVWDFTAEGGAALGRMLRENASIASITIGQTTIDVTKSIRGCDEIQLDPGKFGDAGAALVAHACDPTTKSIDLKRKQVGIHGINALFEATQRCAQLAEINGMSVNDLKAHSGDTLDLSALSADTSEACWLIRMIKEKTSLTDLTMSNNAILAKSHPVLVLPLFDRDAGCDSCGQNVDSGTLAGLSTGVDYDQCDCCYRSPNPLLLLVETLKGLRRLTRLSLRRCGLVGMFGVYAATEFDTLGRALAELPVLAHLNLGDNNWDLHVRKRQNDLTKGQYWDRSTTLLGVPLQLAMGFTPLIDGLVQSQSLEELVIEERVLDVVSLRTKPEVLIEATAQPPCEAIAIAKLVETNSQLRNVNLGNISMIAEVGEALKSVVDALPNLETVTINGILFPLLRLQTAQTTLAFTDAALPKHFGRIIASVITRSSALEELDLRGHNFEDHNVDIADAAADMKGLSVYNKIPLMPQDSTLDLSGKKIMQHGVAMLCKRTLTGGVAIVNLDVSYSGLDGSSMATLADGILSTHSVTSLNISGNSLGVQGIAALADDLLAVNPFVRTLEARSIGFETSDPRELPQSIEKLSRAIELNTSLVRFDLRDNAGVDDRSAAALRRTMVEKRPVVPCALNMKRSFLMCNNSNARSHLHLPTPSETDTAAMHSFEGAMLPVPLIFAFLAETRELLLDNEFIAAVKANNLEVAEELVTDRGYEVTDFDCEHLLDRSLGSDAWSNIVLHPGASTLTDRLMTQYPRLKRAALAPEMLVSALSDPAKAPIATKLLNQGAAINDALCDLLLASREGGGASTWWREIVLDEDRLSLTERLMGGHARLKEAALNPEMLIAAAKPTTSSIALRLLEMGAVCTDAVASALLDATKCASISADAVGSCSFERASRMAGALVLESSHPLEANIDVSTRVDLPGATLISVKFDEQTQTFDNASTVTIEADGFSKSFHGRGPDAPFPGKNGQPVLQLKQNSLTITTRTDRDGPRAWGWRLVISALFPPGWTPWHILVQHQPCSALVQALMERNEKLKLAAQTPEMLFVALSDPSKAAVATMLMDQRSAIDDALSDLLLATPDGGGATAWHKIVFDDQRHALAERLMEGSSKLKAAALGPEMLVAALSDAKVASSSVATLLLDKGAAIDDALSEMLLAAAEGGGASKWQELVLDERRSALVERLMAGHAKLEAAALGPAMLVVALSDPEKASNSVATLLLDKGAAIDDALSEMLLAAPESGGASKWRELVLDEQRITLVERLMEGHAKLKAAALAPETVVVALSHPENALSSVATLLLDKGAAIDDALSEMLLAATPRTDGEISATKLREGDEVEARYRGESAYYPGRITRDRGDGSYDINYDDYPGRVSRDRDDDGSYESDDDDLENESRVPEELIRGVKKSGGGGGASKWQDIVLDERRRVLAERLMEGHARLKAAALGPAMLAAALSDPEKASVATRLLDQGAAIDDALSELLLAAADVGAASKWQAIMLDEDRRALADRLMEGHAQLKAAALGPEMLVAALSQPSKDALATQLLDRGAAIDDALSAMLLAVAPDGGGASIFQKIVLNEERRALADRLMGGHARLEAAALGSGMLVAAARPATSSIALRLLAMGAGCTDEVASTLLEPTDCVLMSPDTVADWSFERAGGMPDAVVLESPHPLEADMDALTPVSIPHATSVFVKFDERTETFDSYSKVTLEAGGSKLRYYGRGERADFPGKNGQPVLQLEQGSLTLTTETDGDGPRAWGWRVVIWRAPRCAFEALLMHEPSAPLVDQLAERNAALAAERDRFRSR